MASVLANGITIEYESFGPKDREAILLIMGHSAHLTRWPVQLCERLVSEGYRVIRFDNRDCGLSTKLDHLAVPDWPAVERARDAGQPLPIPYSLDEMTRDAVRLLDALEVPAAHIVGASLGGMISHLVAADYPQRTLSLTSIMCTASNPAFSIITETAKELLATLVFEGDEAAIIESMVRFDERASSPGFPTPDAVRRANVRAEFKRNFCPAGSARQGGASMTAPDRRAKLATVRVPAVVLHGQDDPGVPIQGAHDIANSLPDSELRIIPGMGHDFALGLVPIFADAITSAATRATQRRRA